MSSFEWPGEGGWPYPDPEKELVDPDAWIDDDAVALRATPPRLDALDPLERRVIVAHYGIDGRPTPVDEGAPPRAQPPPG